MTRSRRDRSVNACSTLRSFAVGVVGLLVLAPGPARAFVLTGTWQGIERCGGGYSTAYREPSEVRLEITKRTADARGNLNARLTPLEVSRRRGDTYHYNGRIPSAGGGEATLALCETHPDLRGRSELMKLARLSDTQPDKFKALSIIYLPHTVYQCKLTFRRVGSTDPGITQCPWPCGETGPTCDGACPEGRVCSEVGLEGADCLCIAGSIACNEDTPSSQCAFGSCPLPLVCVASSKGCFCDPVP